LPILYIAISQFEIMLQRIGKTKLILIFQGIIFFYSFYIRTYNKI